MCKRLAWPKKPLQQLPIPVRRYCDKSASPACLVEAAWTLAQMGGMSLLARTPQIKRRWGRFRSDIALEVDGASTTVPVCSCGARAKFVGIPWVTAKTAVATIVVMSIVGGIGKVGAVTGGIGAPGAAGIIEVAEGDGSIAAVGAIVSMGALVMGGTLTGVALLAVPV